MADSFITQCPHCGTSFRVRNEQLAVANGSVRCGACLQVFSARNHVVTTAVPAQKPAATPIKSVFVAKKPAPAAPAARAVKPAPKPAAKRNPLASPPPPPKEEFGFTSDDEDDAEFLFADGDDDDFLFEDGADDSLFDEDEQDDGLGELSDSFMNLNDSSNTQKTPNHFQRETQEMETDILDDDTDDESWAESMLEEIEKETTSKPSNPAVFESRDVGQRRPAPREQMTTQAKNLMDFDDDFGSTGTFVAPSASQVVSKASQEIELDFNADDRLHRLRPLGWLVVILLLVLLAGQFAWLTRDTYARMDQWRGLYQQACDLFGCTLPEQVDLDAIRTSVLVREHKDPLLQDIRMVDVVLTNKAPFKQPFPTLLMQYTDVNGQLVADQSFHPDNYLKGELTGVELMPINTRVYISFPIRTPAKSAVNYQLILKRNSN